MDLLRCLHGHVLSISLLCFVHENTLVFFGHFVAICHFYPSSFIYYFKMFSLCIKLDGKNEDKQIDSGEEKREGT